MQWGLIDINQSKKREESERLGLVKPHVPSEVHPSGMHIQSFSQQQVGAQARRVHRKERKRQVRVSRHRLVATPIVT